MPKEHILVSVVTRIVWPSTFNIRIHVIDLGLIVQPV